MFCSIPLGLGFFLSKTIKRHAFTKPHVNPKLAFSGTKTFWVQIANVCTIMTVFSVLQTSLSPETVALGQQSARKLISSRH